MDEGYRPAADPEALEPATLLPIPLIAIAASRAGPQTGAMNDALNELRRLVAHAENRRTETGIPGVAMVKGVIPEHQLTGMYEPMVNLILQGAKTITIGDRVLRFDPASYFVMSIDVPATGHVEGEGPDLPYMAVNLTLEPGRIATLLGDLPPDDGTPHDRGGFSVSATTPALLDAWVRMLRLMEAPHDVPALAPAYEREILYRVLQGPHGWMLRDLAAPDTALARVRRTIQWLREHATESFEVEQLAEVASMSPSTFHRHFKAVTAMSPIQFQKRIRLLQARQLLVAQGRPAAAVAFDVGYESPSQFTREYARFFGMPPAKDAARVRASIRL
jgi:AraC-like DNA-binding protein